MEDSKKVSATRGLLKQQGETPEEIDAILNLIRVNESKENVDSIRSWVAVIISAIALTVSILVAIFK